MRKLACSICPTGAHFLDVGEEDLPREDGESLAAWWLRIQDFARGDGTSVEFLRVLAGAVPLREEGQAIVFAGVPREREGWLSHMVPIWTGREARAEEA